MSSYPLAELAQWVPLRLTAQERALLTVLEQTLNVSEYTDHVDVTTASSSAYYYSSYASNQRRDRSPTLTKTRRILNGLLEACHTSTGLVVASGQEKELAHELFQHQSQYAFKQNHNYDSFEQSSADSMPTNGISGANKTNPVAAILLGNGKKSKKHNENKALKEQRKLEKAAKKNGKKNHKSKAQHQESSYASSPLAGLNSRSWASRDPAENEALFQTMFEIGRRNKVLNPASMRATHGKLMYMLQDAQNPTVASSLGFSLHKDLMLVRPWLEQHGCADLLHDARLECAIQFISDRDALTGEKLDRSHVEALVQGKYRVMEDLITQYSCDATTTATTPNGRSSCHPSSTLNSEQVRRAIESMADAIAYIESNVGPVQRMLRYLEENFDPDRPQKGYTLALKGSSRPSYYSGSSNYARYGLSAYGSSSGSDGPTLNHSHSDQYVFVWQSLRLWAKVMRHMHRLWVCADDDLLSTTSTYHLYNTGQGLNRVQSCPRVRKVMSHLLAQTQQEAGRPWVGLSVIHLGDRDVPNALIFIDKYTQIPRFLNPIVAFLQGLPELCEAVPSVRNYVHDQFGSLQQLQMLVLVDYFKHGFDGSGDDGGSCIDGRLTSSWNWTSKIAKKPYYHALMLSGFQGFDGEFR